MSDNEYTLAMRIRSEAAIADRTGQMGRLEAIADEVERLSAHDAEKDRQIAELRERAEAAEAKIAATIPGAVVEDWAIPIVREGAA